MIVTMEHCRKAKMCRRGVKAFIESKGLDWNEFRKKGLPLDEIEKTGDAMALKVCEIVKNGN